MTIWNIPQKFTQGDRLNWLERIDNYNSLTTELEIFIRGTDALNLVGEKLYNGWGFEISRHQSMDLRPGKYRAQIVVTPSEAERFTFLDHVDLFVQPSFENLTQVETRSADEIELGLITKAIARLASGAVSEYRIGDREMRYQDLRSLTERQRELRLRIKYANRGYTGGQNVGIRFDG